MTSHRAAAPPRSGRRLWIWPLLIALAWIAIGGVTGPMAGKLAEVQENDNAAFLPSSTESTEVQDKITRFSGQELLPAVVVFESPERLTRADLSEIAERSAGLADVDGVVDRQVFPPLAALETQGRQFVSADGQALQIVVPLGTTDGERLQAAVTEMREVLGTEEDGGGGLSVYVTGPGGVLADFVEAFGAIDGILLVVALVVVLVILLVVYRSPILPLVVLFSSVLALGAASGVIYALADNDVLDLNGQSQGILFILVVGAATDYALLLVSRFREELREHESAYDAMRVAYRGAFEPILASALTVVLGLLCLLLSDLSSNQGLGPVGAIGVASAMVVTLTFLPAVLILLGRAAFWPFRPAYGSDHPSDTGLWGKVAAMVGRRPRMTWVATVVALGVAAAFVPQFEDEGIAQTDLFLTEVESVNGQDALARHFPSGTGTPAYVLAQQGQLADVSRLVEQEGGIASVTPVLDGPPSPQAQPLVIDGQVLLEATLADEADTPEAEATVDRLREDLDQVGTDVLVGGQTAIQLDTRTTSVADRNLIIPVILLVIFVVLALLLRALVAPLLLIVANVLSFGATLGVSALVFNHLFDFPGGDPAVTLIAFVFLVALGIDYSIFLMTRVREESLRRGTHPGILKGLSVTGGVITSAGIVLAATFSALGVLPILFLAQIAFIVAFGVLLDTIVVRSLLVPALAYDVGPKIWWPSRLARTPDRPEAPVVGRHVRRSPSRDEAPVPVDVGSEARRADVETPTASVDADSVSVEPAAADQPVGVTTSATPDRPAPDATRQPSATGQAAAGAPTSTALASARAPSVPPAKSDRRRLALRAGGGAAGLVTVAALARLVRRRRR